MKKLFFGLFLAAVAVSGSAFTAALPPSGTVYGSTSGSNYTQRPGSYNPGNCAPAAKVCAYVVTPAGQNQFSDTALTPELITQYLEEGWIQANGQGIYQ